MKTTKKYWIAIEGQKAEGPFKSLAAAEQWIIDSSAHTWLTSCGCLRDGDPEIWGSEHVILEEVCRVRPVPPEKVTMRLERITNND